MWISLCLPAKHTLVLLMMHYGVSSHQSLFIGLISQFPQAKQTAWCSSFYYKLCSPAAVTSLLHTVWYLTSQTAPSTAAGFALNRILYVLLFLHLHVCDTHWDCSVPLSNQCTFARVGRENENPPCWIFEQSSVWGQRSWSACRCCKQESLCCNSHFLCVWEYLPLCH